MDNKKIQSKRMLSYFIESAEQIIEEEGIDKVTLRKVAKKAGYNTATLYNYFNSLEHLLFYASMKYFKEYILDIGNYIGNCENKFEEFIGLWTCFFVHSFNKPQIFYNLLFSKYKDTFEKTLGEYYEIFPEELSGFNNGYVDVFKTNTFGERNKKYLIQFIESGVLNIENVDKVNDIFNLYFQSYLYNNFILKKDSNIEKCIIEVSETLLFLLKFNSKKKK